MVWAVADSWSLEIHGLLRLVIDPILSRHVFAFSPGLHTISAGSKIGLVLTNGTITIPTLHRSTSQFSHRGRTDEGIAPKHIAGTRVRIEVTK